MFSTNTCTWRVIPFAQAVKRRHGAQRVYCTDRAGELVVSMEASLLGSITSSSGSSGSSASPIGRYRQRKGKTHQASARDQLLMILATSRRIYRATARALAREWTREVARR